MILYVKYPKEFTKKSTKAKKKSANLQDAKPTQKQSVAFWYTSNQQPKN